MINLWLDDCRPAPEGWVWVKTVDEAKPYLERGEVQRASLDHDLGACDACLGGLSEMRWSARRNFQEMPNCDHFGTGYTLVCWMEETRFWPVEKPTVHSLNFEGARRMRMAIDRYYEEHKNG
jgi:hypothetical protein